SRLFARSPSSHRAPSSISLDTNARAPRRAGPTPSELPEDYVDPLRLLLGLARARLAAWFGRA
ncbi:hypothetical protein OMR07_23605, partial [Methylobacterium organophilum]|nr:hypothetical protein [Methylobacterium organophilum]